MELSKKKYLLKEIAIWLSFGLLLLAIDLISKNLVVHFHKEIEASGGIVLIPNFLRINYLINENIAFGMSLGDANTNRIFFSIVALSVSVGITIYLIYKWKTLKNIYKAAGIMVIAGAIGNVIDRICYSASYLDHHNTMGVVDWIDFYGIWSFNFNIADSCVVIAAIMIIVTLVIESISEVKNTPKNEIDNTKVLSKTERETLELREKDKIDE